MAEAAIILENVSVDLGGHLVLDSVTCQIDKARLTAIMGPNGAGKTTLLHAILGLIPYRGRIEFGYNKTTERPRIGYVPQKLDLDRGSPITVRDFLVSGLSSRPLWMGINSEIETESKEILNKVGVVEVFLSPIGKISGGELQRVLLAQALLGKPDILLLDEPAAAVDISGEALFCELLDEIHEDLGLTTVLVTHDLSVVATHAHNVLCLHHSLICSGARDDVLTRENLRRVFSPHIDVFLQRQWGTSEESRTDDGNSD
ncbi:MAG: metal ABC transporter ATP-binding protein [bacterium]